MQPQERNFGLPEGKSSCDKAPFYQCNNWARQSALHLIRTNKETLEIKEEYTQNFILWTLKMDQLKRITYDCCFRKWDELAARGLASKLGPKTSNYTARSATDAVACGCLDFLEKMDWGNFRSGFFTWFCEALAADLTFEGLFSWKNIYEIEEF